MLTLLLVLFTSTVTATIDDKAGFFSPTAINKANKILSPTYNKVTLETIETIPKGVEPKQFLLSRIPRNNFSGIYILLTKSPRKAWFVPNRKISQLATKDKLSAVRAQMISKFRQNDYDGGLLVVANSLMQIFTQVTATNNSHKMAVTSVESNNQTFWGWWLVLAALLAFAVWFILRRRTTRPSHALNKPNSRPTPTGCDNNSGGGGGIGGGGIGGGGIGGGGWLRGILGGVAGAMAGNWLYDRFLGSSSSEAQAATPPPSTEQVATEVPPPAFDNSADSSNNNNYAHDEADFDNMAGDFAATDDWGGDSGGDEW